MASVTRLGLFLCLTIVLLSAPFGSAQLPALYASPGLEYGKANALDAQGNYINAALFQNTIAVNSNENLDAQGAGTDVALTKYDSSGQLLWAKRMGGTSSEGPHGVATDAVGNIFMTGYFGTPQTNAISNFDPLGSPAGNVSAEGGEDAFLAKYDSGGNFLWAFGLGNTGATTQERAWDLAVDAQGNSYVGGGFWGSMDFNPLGTPHVQSISNANGGLFLAKYDPNGLNQWAIVIDANIANVFAEGYITFDLNAAEDKIYVAGNFRGANVNVNPLGNPAVLNSDGMADMFLAAYDASNGTLDWVHGIGSAEQDLVAPGALRLDHSDQVWFTGRLSGTNSVDFDPGAGSAWVNNSSLFLSAFDANGNFLSARGMNSGVGDGGHRVGFDAQDNVYLAGWMSGSLDFGNGISANAQSATADVFIAKYSNTGACQWVNHFGGNNSSGNSICAGMVVDAQGNSYITGQLYGTDADIDPSSNSYLMSSAGSNDCFVIRYNSDGSLYEGPLTTSLSPSETQPVFSIFPNPAQTWIRISFAESPLAPYKVSVLNAQGALVVESQVAGSGLLLDVQHLLPGCYFVLIQDGASQMLGRARFVKH